MLKHYKELIENRKFNEYDIYSFLILIRWYFPSNEFKLIKELADTMCHSRKDRGIIYENINNCIDNNYEHDENGIIGYNSYPIDKWNEEWKKYWNYLILKLMNLS